MSHAIGDRIGVARVGSSLPENEGRLLLATVGKVCDLVAGLMVIS